MVSYGCQKSWIHDSFAVTCRRGLYSTTTTTRRRFTIENLMAIGSVDDCNLDRLMFCLILLTGVGSQDLALSFPAGKLRSSIVNLVTKASSGYEDDERVKR